MPLTPAELAAEFPLEPGLAYLNHAGVSPWPHSAYEAVRQFAEDNIHRGAEHYPAWLAVETEVRALLAGLIKAPTAASVALLKNTSEGLSFVASGLNWRAGDEVVIPAREFPSNRIPWLALEARGVTVREVDVLEHPEPEAALIAACGPNTRVLSVSGSHYINGLSLDLNKLGEFCRAERVFFVIDAIQTVGVRPFDVEANQCDVAVADAHKWLLGPEGIALFYVRPGAMEHLRVSEYGWHMLAAAGDYDRSDWALAPDARRYECGSPNLLGIHALAASLRLLHRHGLATVYADVLKNISYLIDRLNKLPGVEVRSPALVERRAGIVNVRLGAGDLGRVASELRSQRVCIAVRGGGLRFSPHFYTPESVLDLAVDRLERVLKCG